MPASERAAQLEFWDSFGYSPVAEGSFSATQSEKLYGHASNLSSIRLRHTGSDAFSTGFVRLQCWEKINHRGLGDKKPLVIGSRWMGMYTSDILQVRDSLEGFSSGKKVGWLSPLVSAPLVQPPPEVSLQQPFVGLRETLFFSDSVRVAFIQRAGFDRPGFGTIDSSLPYSNSEGSHANIVQPTKSFDTEFYKNAFGLETAPFGEAHDSGDELPTQVALQLDSGQLFRVERLRAPECPTGLLQVYSPYFDAPDYRELSRPGHLGLGLYCFQVSELACVVQLLKSEGAQEMATEFNEFGEPSCVFVAPDGYTWAVTGA